LGEELWERIYEQAYSRYGVRNLDIDTFTKVWIVPDKVSIHTNGISSFIVDAKMRVLLEKDYLSLEKNSEQTPKDQPKNEADINIINDISSEISREIILPILEKEINSNKHFAPLRQMYHALILATWYKENFKKTYLAQSYANQQKVDGIKLDNTKGNEEIYQQYLKTIKEGIYNYIREDYDPLSQQIIPRKYFSGGTNFVELDQAMVTAEPGSVAKHLQKNPGKFSSVDYDVFPIVISSKHKGSTKGIHWEINEKAEIIIKKIGQEIAADFNEETEIYDIRGKVEQQGGIITTHWGEVRINNEDNMLEILDLRFDV